MLQPSQVILKFLSFFLNQIFNFKKGSPAVAGQKHGGHYAMGHVDEPVLDIEAPTAADLKKAAHKAEKKAEKKVFF